MLQPIQRFDETCCDPYQRRSRDIDILGVKFLNVKIHWRLDYSG
jgi:hypothetical protein